MQPRGNEVFHVDKRPGEISNLFIRCTRTEKDVNFFFFKRTEKGSIFRHILDYCKNCLLGMLNNQLLKLQRVQNTAITIDTQTKRSDHITPILRKLHWLPVEMRIDYKIMCLVYSCMNRSAPQYLRELIHRYLPVRHLRSSTQFRLRIPSFDQGNNENT